MILPTPGKRDFAHRGKKGSLGELLTGVSFRLVGEDGGYDRTQGTADGRTVFAGLRAGEYLLTETKSLEGYVPLKPNGRYRCGTAATIQNPCRNGNGGRGCADGGTAPVLELVNYRVTETETAAVLKAQKYLKNADSGRFYETPENMFAFALYRMEDKEKQELVDIGYNAGDGSIVFKPIAFYESMLEPETQSARFRYRIERDFVRYRGNFYSQERFTRRRFSFSAMSREICGRSDLF